ncbi:hypothetical protein [uncultured Methanospirillum sp.]|uniref:hypothetical protein n=1 Tax=uncultured Methanospirillum sp. TaxID=262503 RepID=UPI0029C7B2CA|nr:hypothetical protein [uncultured Methanospirillum sp.]
MKFGSVVLLVILALVVVIGFAAADRLPNQSPENQVFSIDTAIDATGSVDSSSKMDWLITTPGAIETSILAHHNADGDWLRPQGKVIADTQYRDSILTNGGKLAENKNFDFNSKDQPTGLNNIDSSKVMTYASTEGSHLIGEEEYTFDGAGEAKKADDNIRCVFSTNHGEWLPPFCNIVSAKSALVNMNSAQISSKGSIRAVAATDDIPAEVNYQIAVTPDANSGSGFAEGTVKTTLTGSIMEGRGSGAYWTNTPARSTGITSLTRRYYGINGEDIPWDDISDVPDTLMEFKPSATNSWKDSTTVTGGIKTFQKAFGYKSGFRV